MEENFTPAEAPQVEEPKVEEPKVAEPEVEAPKNNDVDSNKLFAILAYFGILVLIPIFVAKDSKFARFHANQGLILIIGEIAASIIAAIPHLGWIGSIVSLICFIFAIIGIINAAKGEFKELPYIGKYQILK